QAAQFAVAMPKAWDQGDVRYIPYWTGDAGAGGVTWSLRAVAVNNDGALDASWGTAVDVEDTFIAADDLHIGPVSDPVTVGGTPADISLVLFELFRDVD